MSRTYWRAALLGTVLAAVGTTGCAEERDPINRVQANALSKSFFVGQDLQHPGDDPEFWTQATIVDAPYGVSNGWLYPSTWSQSPNRIKWQITEDLLLGRMTYEHVDN
ncbi:MAG: hypothetical protein JRI23_27225, partial [Deltaproteobacteria bacterium]|nr:hypothetical protein [Deltaproteobacteria bacterium]MBW2535774.1 hypothetical protein [Deltaproteobacteria bacterium]